MAIATKNTATKQTVVQPTIDELYHTQTTTATEKAAECLAAITDGSPWTLTAYYSQILRKDDPLAFVDLHLSPSYQQYRKIYDLVLYVTGSLSTSIDASTTQANVSGSASVPGFMVFNTGDAFIAKLGSAYGLFRIDSVTKMTLYSNSGYRLEYSMVGPIDMNGPVYADLELKSSEVAYYDAASLGTCGGPLLTSEDVTELTDIRDAYNLLADIYVKMHLDPDTDSFVLTINGTKYHDPHLNRFIQKTIPNEYYRNSGCRGFNTNSIIDELTILDYLMEPGKRRYTTPVTQFGYIHRTDLAFKASISSVGFMIVDYHMDKSAVNALSTMIEPVTFVAEVLYEAKLIPVMSNPLDETYLFSPSFYEGTPVTLLEHLVEDYLQGKALNRSHLQMVLNLYKQLPHVYSYHYTPVILLLLKYTGAPAC